MSAGRIQAPGSAPRALQADGRVDPIGVRSDRPRLSWKCDTGATRFRVFGASTREEAERGAGDVFDVTTSARSVEWPGPALHSRQRIWWAVADDRGARSDPAFVEAPLWRADDWQGSPVTHPAWVRPGAIAPAALPELRTDFVVPDGIARARMYLSGAGIIIPRLNGSSAIDGVLEPGYSDLRVSSLASAWDVTDAVRPGRNRMDVGIAGGIAYLPRGDRYTKFERTGEPVWVHMQLEVHHHDGSTSIVSTDESWQSRLGPVVASHWYGGESHVERHATPWEPAIAVSGTAPFRWRGAPPIRVVDVLTPKRTTAAGGRRTIDFGVNSAGRPRVRLTAATADVPVTLMPGELLVDGAVDQTTTGAPIWDSVTPATPRADWAPTGVYHGGRYWDVSGLSDAESEDAVVFEVLRADNQRVGSFTSTDPFLSRLHEVVDRAVQSNMFSVFTDCPHREKLGWLEQLHYCFEVLARGYDVKSHLEDMVRHMIEAQISDGLVPNIAPELVVFDIDMHKGDINAFRSDPNWGRAIVEVPWLLYRHYGDPGIIAEALPTMSRYIDHVGTRTHENILDFGLGDWIEVDTSTPRALVATHGFASMLDTAAECAAVIGEHEVGERWRLRADEVWAAFRDRFRDPRTGVWGSGSQASWALAWSARQADPGDARGIAEGLLDAIQRADDTLTVGEVALPHLIRALTDTGHAGELDRLIRREDAPGYGHQIAEGATSLTESWQGSGGQTGVSSQNHFMLGVIDDWLTGDVAGLRQAKDSVGWESVVVAPHPLDGVGGATTTFDSPRGHMTVAWRRDTRGVVHVATELPAGVRCEIRVPPGAVLHSGLADLDDLG